MSKKKYNLLVFDWDGTLMDSAARIVDSLTLAIEQADLPTRAASQLRHIIGLGLNEAIDHLYPEGINSDQRQLLIQSYRHQFLDANKTPAPLFDGVAEMLETFSEQGYCLAVATGKSRAGLNRALTNTGFQSLFPVSRCADESGSKPHPAMLNEILGEYNLIPSQALMIGDTAFDIEMAHRASVDAVAVTHGAHSRQQLVQAQPLAMLDQINQLPLWLNQNSHIVL